MRIYLLIFVLITLSTISCAVGPDTEKKSKLNYLSGEHYEGQGRVGPFPVYVERKKVRTLLEGYITVNEYTPLGHTKLLLQKDNKTILETRTTQKGLFKFHDYLENGKYIIKINSELLEWQEEIKVDSYELKDLHFNIERLTQE
ncbi:MAG: hypothetical protein OEV42_20765 [Deltaproteobacteria bacterium]|nr:hypothetical protein [Deltaproteobacteria bacterium]